MSKNDDLLARLKSTAAKPTAGAAQAKRSIEQKSRETRKAKAAAPATEEKPRACSMYRYPGDDRLILHLVGEMAQRGVRVNESQILRAGLRALDALAPDAIEALIRDAASGK
jgi:hypothetical protein